MYTAIQKIVQLKSEIKLEYVYNVLIAAIIVIILMLALIALHRPIRLLLHAESLKSIALKNNDSSIDLRRNPP